MSSTTVSFFNEQSFPLTSKIVPHWSSYQGLSTTQKITKIFNDLFKTILFCTGIIPAVTATIDFFTKKKIVVVPPPVEETKVNPSKNIIEKAANIAYDVIGIALNGWVLSVAYSEILPKKINILVSIGSVIGIGLQTLHLSRVLRS